MLVSFSCPHCHQFQNQELSWPIKSSSCASCGSKIFEHGTDTFLEGKSLDQCPICGGTHLYRRKDFNQKLGILLVVVGVLLAYFTYGLSLLGVTLIDFFLFRKVREVGICYQCHAEFRKSLLIDQLVPFDLELFDYYRNLKAPKDLDP